MTSLLSMKCGIWHRLNFVHFKNLEDLENWKNWVFWTFLELTLGAFYRAILDSIPLSLVLVRATKIVTKAKKLICHCTGIIQFISFEMCMDRPDKCNLFLNCINFNYQTLLLLYGIADFPLKRSYGFILGCCLPNLAKSLKQIWLWCLLPEANLALMFTTRLCNSLKKYSSSPDYRNWKWLLFLLLKIVLDRCGMWISYER